MGVTKRKHQLTECHLEFIERLYYEAYKINPLQ